MPVRHDPKVAFIAGGGSGIGAATAALLGDRGDRIVVADLNIESAAHTCDSITAAGGTAVAVPVDISDEESVRSAFRAAVDAYGTVDLLFNVAADMSILPKDTDVLDLDLELWDRTLAVGLRGYVLTIREALPMMMAAGHGSIVNTSSGAAFVGMTQHAAYAATKAAVNALTRHVATKWGRSGIRCNAVAPGVVLTDAAIANVGPDLDRMVDANPSGRLGQPVDIAATVAFLLGDDATWINGQVINVDGGSVMK